MKSADKSADKKEKFCRWPLRENGKICRRTAGAAALLLTALLLGGCTAAQEEVTLLPDTQQRISVETESTKEALPAETQESEISQNLAQEEETQLSAEAQDTAQNASDTADIGQKSTKEPAQTGSFSLSDLLAYDGSSPYTVVNGNVPYFTEDDLTTASYETYSNLDYLGRCGVAMACVGQDLMPTEQRGDIGSVKPTGWHTVKYDIVSGKYLYNRCHLIAYELAGENANERNLITGTRYFNVEGMLPFENMVHDYVVETGFHVMYRVTPVFEGQNLVADGVLMEAVSVEDEGDGIEFCVFCYNVQPGITIDYATGDSQEDGTLTASSSSSAASSSSSGSSSSSSLSSSSSSSSLSSEKTTYILNTNTKKFHLPTCSSVAKMADKNKQEYTGTRDEVIAMGYSACQSCHP